MPGVLAVVGETKRAAEAKYERLQSLIHPELGVATLSDMVGLDLSSYPLDGPLPEVPLTNTQQGRQRVVIDLARREGLTIRQLYQRVSGARAHRIIFGTAAEIADSLELLVSQRRGGRFQHHVADLSRRPARLCRPCRSGVAAAQALPHRLRRQNLARKSRTAASAQRFRWTRLSPRHETLRKAGRTVIVRHRL